VRSRDYGLRNAPPPPRRFRARGTVRLRFRALTIRGLRHKFLSVCSAKERILPRSGCETHYSTALCGRPRSCSAAASRSDGAGGGIATVPGPNQSSSELRVPGQPPKYPQEIPPQFAQPWVHQDLNGSGTGRSKRGYVTALDRSRADAHPTRLWYQRRATDSTRQQPVRRLGTGRFWHSRKLKPVPCPIGGTPRSSGGTRLRSVFALQDPARADAQGRIVIES